MKASKGDLIKTKIYVSEEYPEGSILKVDKVIEKINEIACTPTWYQEGMKCFGFIVFLEEDDYEVVKSI